MSQDDGVHGDGLRPCRGQRHGGAALFCNHDMMVCWAFSGQDLSGPTENGLLPHLHNMQRHEATRGVEPAPPELLVPQACEQTAGGSLEPASSQNMQKGGRDRSLIFLSLPPPHGAAGSACQLTNHNTSAANLWSGQGRRSRLPPTVMKSSATRSTPSRSLHALPAWRPPAGSPPGTVAMESSALPTQTGQRWHHVTTRLGDFDASLMPLSHSSFRPASSAVDDLIVCASTLCS